MTRVIAAIDNSTAARPVLAAATAFAGLVDAEVEALHVCEDGESTAIRAAEAAGVPFRRAAARVLPALQEEGAADDVAALVLGARGVAAGRRPAGHVALQLATRLPKPLLVVPPDAAPPAIFDRILVPLNGERTTAVALAETLTLACHHELDVVVLHVHELDSLPLFTDQPQHEQTAWAQEFLRRHCPYPERVQLEVRVGSPGQHVLDVAEETGAEMLVFGWGQDLGGGHAQVVREALARSRVPVLLVPIAVGTDLIGDRSEQLPALA